MEIVEPARKHGIGDADIWHAYRFAIRMVAFEYDGEERVLVIGPSRSGAILELVAVPADTCDRIIHADALRPKFYGFLR